MANSPSDGTVAVVTGATRGVGRAIALELARSGYRIVVVGRSTEVALHKLMHGTLRRLPRWPAW